MKWLSVSIVVLLIAWYEWSMINRRNKKEKAVLIILLFLGWLLAILLVYFPDLPGPTQLIEKLFRPLGRWMEG